MRVRSLGARKLSLVSSIRANAIAPAPEERFGFAKDEDIERKFRETPLHRAAPISTNRILGFIAEWALGLPKPFRAALNRAARPCA